METNAKRKAHNKTIPQQRKPQPVWRGVTSQQNSAWQCRRVSPEVNYHSSLNAVSLTLVWKVHTEKSSTLPKFHVQKWDMCKEIPEPNTHKVPSACLSAKL